MNHRRFFLFFSIFTLVLGLSAPTDSHLSFDQQNDSISSNATYILPLTSRGGDTNYKVQSKLDGLIYTEETYQFLKGSIFRSLERKALIQDSLSKFKIQPRGPPIS